MFSVNELTEATAGKLINRVTDITATGISTDTRAMLRGDVFIARKGNNFNGHDFIEEASKKAYEETGNGRRPEYV